MKNLQPSKCGCDWDLKIGSRYVTMYDYGEHLLRMLKRAVPYQDFVNERRIEVQHLIGVELMKPEHKKMSVKEFEDIISDLLYGDKDFSYRRLINYIVSPSEQDLISLIKNNAAFSVYIGKKSNSMRRKEV